MDAIMRVISENFFAGLPVVAVFIVIHALRKENTRIEKGRAITPSNVSVTPMNRFSKNSKMMAGSLKKKGHRIYLSSKHGFIGLGILTVMTKIFYSSPYPKDFEKWGRYAYITSNVGLSFIWLATLWRHYLHPLLLPQYFDLEQKHFKRGLLSKIPFEQIMGLQVLEKRSYRNRRTYRTYQLNLVLTSGKRFNLLEQHSYNKIEDQAHYLQRKTRLTVYDEVSDYVDQAA